MKARVLSIVLALCLLAGAGALLAAPVPEAPAQIALGENLLFNPSFETEDDYAPYEPPGGHPDCQWDNVCGTALMAPGWTPYWRSWTEEPDDKNVMPEYKAAQTIHTDPVRVRTGTSAQVYFTFWHTHEAGFYQQVEVTPGETYCFSTWAHSWSAEDDNDAYTGPMVGNLRQRVGIDPTGGTDWQSGQITWGDLRVQPDFYEPFVVTATAQAETVTVYAYSVAEWAVKHNDTYWDDANLRQVEPVLPDGSLELTVTAGTPLSVTRQINPNWLCDPSTDWEVTIDPASTFSPTLSTTGGKTGMSMTVTLDSSGLAPGEYESWLRFSSPDTEEALPSILARITVLALDNHLYLPSIVGALPEP